MDKMKTSCISHPEREQLVIIRKWQIEFCEGNQCAAAVMAYFEYWHNWKLDSDEYNKKANDVSDAHGDSRFLSEDVYQFHSMQEISDGILNLYGAKAIAEAIKILDSKKVISIHRNPNPNYFYDKKKYFKFYPDHCNQWLKNHYKSRLGKNAESTSQKSVIDLAKTPNALGKNTALLGENAVSITEINNKDNNQSIQCEEKFSDCMDDKPISGISQSWGEQMSVTDETSLGALGEIIAVLITSGLPKEKLNYPDALPELERLIQAGASADIFVKGYQLAQKATQGKGFGVRYLVKVVDDLMVKKSSLTARRFQSTTTRPRSNQPSTKLESFDFSNEKDDLRNGMSWLGEILEQLSE
jgi:hypothetical protein